MCMLYTHAYLISLNIYFFSFLQQNRMSISETKTTISNSEANLVSQKNKITNMEMALVEEESKFEIIRESLKGKSNR